MNAVKSEQGAGLPAPAASLAALRMLVVAHVRSLPRKRGERFLRELALIVQSEEQIRILFPTRPKHERAAQMQAQDEAAAWARAIMPELLRSLPPP